jgi:hypothetical protein
LKFCQPTNGTFAFALTHKTNPLAKTKEPFYSSALLNAVFHSGLTAQTFTFVFLAVKY